METRQQKSHQMPQEEQWLIDAIAAQDAYSAETLIRLIKEKPMTNSYNHPQLDHLDKDDNSFLFLSIANQLHSITQILLESLFDNDKIIFGKNNLQQTLIWIAAKEQNIDCLSKILPKAMSNYQQKLLHEKIWLLRDRDGNTPLHAAISPDSQIKALTYLLKNILKAEGKKGLILQLNTLTNSQGDTPLHIAFKANNAPAIALLTQYGADWTIVNNEKSAFDYFCENTLLSQQKIISLLAIDTLNKTYQNYVLNLYQQNLLNKNINTSKENYLRLAGLVSLKSLIIANMQTDKIINTKICEKSTHAHLIPHDDNIEIEIEEFTSNTDIIIDIDTDMDKYQHARHSSIFEQKNSDRIHLSDFIKEIDAYIDTLKQPRSSNISTWLGIFAALNCLTFCSIEAWSIYAREKSFDMTDCQNRSIFYQDICLDPNHPATSKNQTDSFYQLFFVTLIYGILSAFILVIPCCTIQHEGTISKKEWEKMIDFLKENILTPLRHLQRKEVPDNHATILTQIETACNELHNYAPRKTILDIFKRISSLLKQIRTHLNLDHYSNNFVLFNPKEKTARYSKKITAEDKLPLLRQY